MQKKRLCLFAGYDKDGTIDDYVIYYIRQLTKVADVFYYGDFDTTQEELNKLKGITLSAAAKKHYAYDFGSWSKIIEIIGWDLLYEYEEVLLVNDSCYGPFYPLQDIFDIMEVKKLDAWSMAGNRFLMSFFMVLSPKIFKNPGFRYFMTHISTELNKAIVIRKYEKGLDALIKRITSNIDCYMTAETAYKLYKENKHEIRKELAKVIPFWPRALMKFKPEKIRLYSDDSLILLLLKFPFLKRTALVDPVNLCCFYYEKLISFYEDYPLEHITKNLRRLKTNQHSINKIVRMRLKNSLKSFMWETKYKHDKYIIRVLKIPVYSKRLDL